MDIVVIRMASAAILRRKFFWDIGTEKLFLPHTAWGHPKVNLGGLNDADLASIKLISNGFYDIFWDWTPSSS